MPKLSISKEDMSRGGRVSQPGWFTCAIADYEEKPAGTDGSTNYIFKYKILGGKNAGQTKLKYFNEKVPGMMGPMWVSLGARADADGNVNVEWDKSTVVTDPPKVLDVYLRRATDKKGNEVDSVEDFRPATNTWAS